MEEVMIASTAMNAIGSISQGNAQAAALNNQAQQADQQAVTARQQGAARESMVRRTNAKRLAEQRASAAQSGFDPNSGSLLSLQGESAGASELDALTSRYEAELQAIGSTNQASSYRANAESARQQGYLNAFGTLTKAGASYFGGTRIGPPAPVEDRTPVPVENIVGLR